MIESSNTNSVPEVVKKKISGFCAQKGIGHATGQISLYIQSVSLASRGRPPFPSCIDSEDSRAAVTYLLCRSGADFFASLLLRGLTECRLPHMLQKLGSLYQRMEKQGASMKIEIPYGSGMDAVEVAEKNIEQVIVPNAVHSADEMETLRGAIFRPMKSPGLDAFLKDRKNILLVVNDATRPTPTGRVMEIIYPVAEGQRISRSSSQRAATGRRRKRNTTSSSGSSTVS